MTNFFKTHTKLMIVIASVLVLVCIWTPVIVMIMDDKGDNMPTESVQSEMTQTESVNSEKEESEVTDTAPDDQSKNSISAIDKSEISSENGNETSSVPKVESSKPNSSFEENTSSEVKPTEVAKKRVICWGDSFTRGMGMSKGEKYPDYLQKLIGEKYEVLNGGSSGEKPHTIAARQGALKVYTSNDIVFLPKATTTDIGMGQNCGLVLEDGTALNINPYGEAFNYEMPANLLTINGIKYTLSVSNQIFKLKRTYSDKPLTIPKGTEIIFSSAESQVGSYCEIFYVGANDNLTGTQADIEKLININKSMISRHGDNCYLVVMPHWTSAFDDALKGAFGDRAVNIREVMCNEGMASIGLKPTDADRERMAKGEVPDSLRLNNNPSENHLNKYGYEILAKVLYERGVQLGFW